jgi:microcystin degradation protein MlrC
MHTASHPFSTLFERVHALEDAGDAVSITLAGGFAYADTPAAGLSVITITNDDQAGANRIANEIASMAWGLREDMAITNVPPKEAVTQAIAWPEHPVVLVDVGDNIGGGTPGDGTVLLRELLAQGAREAVVVIADPESVRAAIAAGPGATVTLDVGGKVDRLHGAPVTVTGTVTYVGDGHWVHDGPENAGVPVNNGPVAIVDVDGVRILLESVKTAPGDLQHLRSAGIDPASQQIIVVKAAVRWRGGYLPITRHHIDVDTPGLGSVNLANFAFERILRPIYPLDPDTTWP